MSAYLYRVFKDNGDVPNNPLPLVVYSGAIDPEGEDPAAAFEGLFHRNGWGGGWRNGIYAFHHYHSTAHEVLGIARGKAEVTFGGRDGETLAVRAGDAILIPAGVGHRRIYSSADFLVVGAYPPGQEPDLLREGAEDKDAIRRRIRNLALPETDPVEGEGALQAAWLRNRYAAE